MSSQTVKSAILLVGGMGTRMQPLTLSTPKPMLELLGRPITEHQIVKARDAGIEEIVLATSFMSEVFTPHFGDGSEFGIKISYAVEEVALGTGGAIRNAARYLQGDGPTMIFNGDVLSAHSLRDQIDFHFKNDAEVSIYLTTVEDARPFGVVELDHDKRISSFREKMDNPPSNVINAGCYIFNRRAINEIPEGEVVSVERTTFPALLNRNARVFGFVDSSFWLDVGNPRALLAATRELLRVEGKSFALGEGVSLESDVTLVDSYISASSSVGSGSTITNSIIGRGAKIGRSVTLTDSFVAAGEVIPDGYIAEGQFFGF